MRPTLPPRRARPGPAPPRAAAAAAPPRPLAGRPLVVVESPAKARKIQEYLGDGATVRRGG